VSKPNSYYPAGQTIDHCPDCETAFLSGRKEKNLTFYYAGGEESKCFQIPGLDFESKRDKVNQDRLQRLLSVSQGYSQSQSDFKCSLNLGTITTFEAFSAFLM